MQFAENVSKRYDEWYESAWGRYADLAPRPAQSAAPDTVPARRPGRREAIRRRIRTAARRVVKVTALVGPGLAVLLYFGHRQYTGRLWYASNQRFIEAVHSIVGVSPAEVRGQVREHWDGRCQHAISATPTEQEVVAALGAPTCVVTAAQARVGPWPLPGYSGKPRAVTNRALVYIRGDTIAYVWIGPSGVVEDIFVGPS